MSDITPKNYSGLMEAYASIYNQPEQIIQEQVEEEIMNLDGDSVKDLYLVLEEKYGYKPTGTPKFK